jgi:hypothetical protein
MFIRPNIWRGTVAPKWLKFIKWFWNLVYNWSAITDVNWIFRKKKHFTCEYHNISDLCIQTNSLLVTRPFCRYTIYFWHYVGNIDVLTHVSHRGVYDKLREQSSTLLILLLKGKLLDQFLKMEFDKSYRRIAVQNKISAIFLRYTFSCTLYFSFLYYYY